MKHDHILRVTAGNGSIRAFIAYTKHTVNEAVRLHNLSPVAAAALGRLLTASAMMGAMQKNKDDLLTIQIKGDGPIGGILVTADAVGHVKGYAVHPEADLPLKPNGKLDVSGIIGAGDLTVIKDLGLKEPYVCKIPLCSGEIAEDIAAYYYQSEQTPSVVALGVLVDVDYTIKEAGGYIIQLLPGADEETINCLEEKIDGIRSVTEMLSSGMSTEDVMNFLLGDFGIDEVTELPCEYRCDCSRERVLRAFISIGIDDLEEILREDKQAELLCHFCDKAYHFSEQELTQIVNKLKNNLQA